MSSREQFPESRTVGDDTAEVVVGPTSLGKTAMALASAAALTLPPGFYPRFKLKMPRRKKYGAIPTRIPPEPRIPGNQRNGPCGCGSGKKAKKCCGAKATQMRNAAIAEVTGMRPPE